MSGDHSKEIMSAYDRGKRAGVYLVLETLGLVGVVAFIGRFLANGAHGWKDWLVGTAFGLFVALWLVAWLVELLATLTGSERLRRWSK